MEGAGERGHRVLQVVRHHQGEGGGDTEVGQEDDEQGEADADRDGRLWVLRLLPAAHKRELCTNSISVVVSFRWKAKNVEIFIELHM